MAEYVYPEVQTVPYGQAVLLEDSIPCPKGYVIHRNGSGVLTLRGITNNTCARFARYQVTFNGNIAVPTDPAGTLGEISLAISISGEPVQSSLAAVTPTATGAYFNVTSTMFVTIPKGCCFNISVENTSATAEPILVRNANVVVTRVA